MKLSVGNVALLDLPFRYPGLPSSDFHRGQSVANGAAVLHYF
jgi:hypothetical protein